VVLLDLVMPRMDGEECLHALRAIDPGVRVVLSSGFDRSGRIGSILESHRVPFLQKPYRLETMAEALGIALSA
jgi:DNA-binding NtrC family response regulator